MHTTLEFLTWHRLMPTEKWTFSTRGSVSISAKRANRSNFLFTGMSFCRTATKGVLTPAIPALMEPDRQAR